MVNLNINRIVKSQSKNPLAYLSKIFAHNNETNL